MDEEARNVVHQAGKTLVAALDKQKSLRAKDVAARLRAALDRDELCRRTYSEWAKRDDSLDAFEKQLAPLLGAFSKDATAFKATHPASGPKYEIPMLVREIKNHLREAADRINWLRADLVDQVDWANAVTALSELLPEAAEVAKIDLDELLISAKSA